MEDSAQRFVFRSRSCPASVSECVKIQFHVHHEKPETGMLTWFLVFLMGVHQSSCVSSRIRVKVSLLDDNQGQQDKSECFSVLKSVRSEKTRENQVVICFWCSVPL